VGRVAKSIVLVRWSVAKVTKCEEHVARVREKLTNLDIQISVPKCSTRGLHTTALL